MSKTIQKAGAKFADTITSEVPKEYIGAITKRVKLIASLRDFPELREKFRLYLNEEYLNAIKDIPEIEQFMTLDDNNTHRLDTIETDEEKTIEIETLDNSTEQLPEGAQWKLNSSGKYMLIINEDGAKKSYSAEVASKKLGITPPIIKNPQSESKLPIARDTKKSVENIAREELSRDVQKTSTEIKEGYKELENPTQTKDIEIQ